MARYIRFRPLAWHAHISMRVEVYGTCQGTVDRETFHLKKIYSAPFCNTLLL